MFVIACSGLSPLGFCSNVSLESKIDDLWHVWKKYLILINLRKIE